MAHSLSDDRSSLTLAIAHSCALESSVSSESGGEQAKVHPFLFLLILRRPEANLQLV